MTFHLHKNCRLLLRNLILLYAKYDNCLKFPSWDIVHVDNSFILLTYGCVLKTSRFLPNSKWGEIMKFVQASVLEILKLGVKKPIHWKWYANLQVEPPNVTPFYFLPCSDTLYSYNMNRFSPFCDRMSCSLVSERRYHRYRLRVVLLAFYNIGWGRAGGWWWLAWPTREIICLEVSFFFVLSACKPFNCRKSST